jgi:hypothetical protein
MKALVVTIWGVVGLTLGTGLSLLATSRDLPDIGRRFLQHHRAAQAVGCAVAGAVAGIAIGGVVNRIAKD